MNQEVAKKMVGEADKHQSRRNQQPNSQKKRCTSRNRVSQGKPQRELGQTQNKVVKSPSDSTIYTPALKLKRFNDNQISSHHNPTRNYDSISMGINQMRMNDFPR